MTTILGKKSFFWPFLAAVLFASLYVAFQPGQLYADAAEYDAIARSILVGRYDLAEAFTPNVPLPTMHREPGYPVFRAAVYAIAGDHPAVILWVQALLSGFAVLIAALAVNRVDSRWGLPVAWLAAVYPGFAVWAGQHYSETFAAFLVSVAGYMWVRYWQSRNAPSRAAFGWALAFGISIGALTLEKASFQILPVFAAVLILAAGPWRKRWKEAALLVAAFLLVVAPWAIRNERLFGEAAITYRTGIVVYTRALKADIPWSRLAASYGSVLVGEATVLRIFPNHPPVIVQLWDRTWDDKNDLLKRGLRYYEADRILFDRGARMIFSSSERFAKYLLWSGIDELRFFGLASPLSPKFGVELIANAEAQAGTLTVGRLALVLGAHGLQIVWWGLIGIGFAALLKKRQWAHPALLIVGYAGIMYAPFDNIPRYAVPILPWIIALIVAALIRSRGSGSDRCRERDPRLVEAANRAYHRAEAELYDASHPEILWCERRHWEVFANQWLGGVASPRNILDIGAGTGFIGSILATHLRPEDAYIAADLSPEMLRRLSDKMASSPFNVRTIECGAEALAVPDASIDVIVVSSVFHHIANPDKARAEMARVLRPGGVLAVMHEPNIAFSSSWVLRKLAGLASRIARFDSPKAGLPAKPDYAPVFRATNDELMKLGLIASPLSCSDIQQLVDVHSPTAGAGGRFEPFGFAPRNWVEGGPMQGWEVCAFETYNFLGKLDPSGPAWRRFLERILRMAMPESGSLFSIVLKKPAL